MIECEKNCNLCGNLKISSKYNIKLTLCSSCYLITSGWVELALTKVHIPILYLPWWDASDLCIVCDKVLEFKPERQSWCLHCYINYTGCRYRLTTNIISGLQINLSEGMFLNSQNIPKYFLDELKSLYQCYNKFDRVIRYYGITRDPRTKEYMLIMGYASGAGLHTIHENNFIHRDCHSGNILLETESFEIMKYTKIIDGERPQVTDDTPVCYVNLMKRCWNSDPSERPSAKEILETTYAIKEAWSEYTSRSLNPFISSSLISLQEYISKEYEYDINII
ncbi:kinase-like domain-containing protein [Rhizophagus irregularis DAOM 181602=DAOM 197198]|nr:kinase-like domain-containing protein [Rhizophagus irregularis DAOM 181602=DAOM 197198]